MSTEGNKNPSTGKEQNWPGGSLFCPRSCSDIHAHRLPPPITHRRPRRPLRAAPLSPPPPAPIVSDAVPSAFATTASPYPAPFLLALLCLPPCHCCPLSNPWRPLAPLMGAPALSAPVAPSPGPTLPASSLAISLITASLSPLLTSCQVLQSSIFDEMDLVASLTICFIFLLHAFLAIKELPPQRRRQHVEGATEGPCEEGGDAWWELFDREEEEATEGDANKGWERRSGEWSGRVTVRSRLEWWGPHEGE